MRPPNAMQGPNSSLLCPIPKRRLLMAGMCEGRVAVITGAGRGIGREYALMLASEGAKVVVNDLGGDRAGAGADMSPAQEVVKEIEAGGGSAVVNGADVSDF